MRQNGSLNAQGVLRLLAENGQDMIYRYRVDPTPHTEYISPAATAITGHTPEEFYADPWLGFKLLHPHDRSTAERILREPEWFNKALLLRWCHPDGNVVHVEHRIVAIRDRAGTLLAIEGIGRDVTQRVEIETRLRASEEQLRSLATRLEEAREEERTHVARELHDHLGQSLTNIKLELTRVDQQLCTATNPQPLAERVQLILGLIDAATESVRKLASGLRPAALDQLGLAAALETEAAAMAHRTGLRFRINVRGESSVLVDEVSTALFRITQEALTNVVRHAAASTVHISLTVGARRVNLHIRDDGAGIDEGRARADAIGLVGMRERAKMLGGECSVVSSKGKGTTVRVSVPLNVRRPSEARTTHAARVAD